VRKPLILKNKQDYYRNVYLLSEHWRNLRKEKLKLNPICEVCGARRRLDVHHLHYRNLYDVLVEDLKTLCRRCHGKVHGIIPKPISKRNRLKKFLKFRKKQIL